MRILLVEDNQRLAESIAKGLREQSFAVDFAFDGKNALYQALNSVSKIFDRFYRADEARSFVEDKISGGAGLGLAIAAWIAKIHNGDLTLEESDSEGPVFRLDLPI